ncbi:MAG: hypothetical protein AAF363_18625 [Bacteroidota bacterium]
MKDELEKFVAENTGRFDIETPRESSWEAIRKGMTPPQEKPKRAFHFWKLAASILLLSTLTLSILLFRQMKNAEGLASLADISPEYVQLEKTYQQSIQEITNRIEYKKVDKTEYAWLFEELQVLEELNENFRKDIHKVRDKERLVRILVDHYEKKIKILKRLEHEIKRDEQKKESDDSRV